MKERARSVSERLELLVEDYLFIENSFERFQVVVDTAHALLEPFPENLRTDHYLVSGCVSRLWLVVREGEGGIFEILLDSESPALKSIGALFCRVYSGGTAAEIKGVSPDFIERLSIDRHLTPTRLRGLQRIRETLIDRVTSES